VTCALPVTPLSLAGALAAGVASSLHCLSMCGGIAGALAMRARGLSERRPMIVLHTAGHQAGRIGGYAILGSAAGLLGQTLASTLASWHIALLLRGAAALLVIALGLQILLGRPLLRPIERAGAHLWRRVAPLIRHAHGGGVGGTLAIGALWALMPCGLVYSMLAIAALSASPGTGAALMLFFGIGTLPAVLGGSIALSCAHSRWLSGAHLSRVAGVLLVTFGLWTAYSALA